MNEMKTIAIIPARYGSTRFPGKPLARLGDRPVIQWVYSAAHQVIDDVVVATDDPRIFSAVEDFGGKAILTTEVHANGTARVYEAFRRLHSDADLVVNIQADEPFVQPEHISQLIRCFDCIDTHSPASATSSLPGIATLVTQLDASEPFDTLSDPNLVKVVIDCAHCAMYFTRSVVPYYRGKPQQCWLGNTPYYAHLGIYAYRVDLLPTLVDLPPTPAESAESLEQLRWLQHGHKIRCAIVDAKHIGIDTPDDLIRANDALMRF